VAERSTQ
jgi:hypothetical protein